MLALRSSGYVLPNTAANQERMEWLATAIRTYKGQASVVQVHGFDDLPPEHLEQLFVEARSRDYQKLLHEAKKVLALSPARRPSGRLNRIRKRLALDEPLISRSDSRMSEVGSGKWSAADFFDFFGSRICAHNPPVTVVISLNGALSAVRNPFLTAKRSDHALGKLLTVSDRRAVGQRVSVLESARQ
jgi:hypothetical protein